MEFSTSRLSRYLGERLGGSVTITNLERFPRGSSRQTWFIGFRKDGGDVEEVVLRTDLPSGSTEPTPLSREHFVYDKLGQTDLPVARVFLWEDDPEWTDQPFYLREKVLGDWRVAHFSDPDPRFDELRMAVAKEHLDTLASVHQLDWQALGMGEALPVPDDAADAAHCYVRHLRALYDQVVVEPMPIVAEACEWLHDHAPVAPCLSLCKGTNGYGEEVFEDGRLVALSDWEEVSIGDPAADFAFMQGFLAPIVRDGQTLWDLERAVAYYNEVSGIGVTTESIGYYHVVRALRALIMMQNAGVAVASRVAPDMRQAWSATEALHLCKHILASAAGMLQPISGERFAELHDTVDANS